MNAQEIEAIDNIDAENVEEEAQRSLSQTIRERLKYIFDAHLVALYAGYPGKCLALSGVTAEAAFGPSSATDAIIKIGVVSAGLAEMDVFLGYVRNVKLYRWDARELLGQGICSEWMHPRALVDLLETSDLIEFEPTSKRAWNYSHWAMYMGIKNFGKYKNTPLVVHYWSISENEPLSVRVDPLEVVAAGQKARRNNKYDSRHEPLSVRKALAKAIERLDETKYHLRSNNCEHFASYSRNGHAMSEQSEVAPLMTRFIEIGILGSTITSAKALRNGSVPKLREE